MSIAHAMSAAKPAPGTGGENAGKTTHFRWMIVLLLFFATTINYIDRAVLGILKPVLEVELGWNQIDYGNVVTAFTIAYALGYVLAGRLLDLIGVRVGYLLSVTLWSLAAMAHAAVNSLTGFGLARGALGLAEGGNFPSAIKTITEWFPKRERAFAMGLFNAGSNIGAVACPLVVPWIALNWGWRSAFLITGAIGFIWVVLWLIFYRSPALHPRVSPAELALIRSEPVPPPVKMPWLSLLRHPQTWAFVIGMTFSAPVWWFYIYWAPDFLSKQHGLVLTGASLPLITIFLVADLGGISGGWLSSRLLKRGWSLNAARKTAMLICALCALPVFMTPLVDNLWVAVALVALAASAHCGFVANLFALVSDTVPFQAVSSVMGIGGMSSALGGAAAAQLVGHVLHYTNNNYIVPFALASVAYLLALWAMHRLLPHWESMKLPAAAARG